MPSSHVAAGWKARAPGRVVLLIAFLLFTIAVHAADVRLKIAGTNALLRVEADHDRDWRVQSSTNFTNWITLTNFGVLISGNQETNAPWRSAGASTNAARFYRALETEGLYDPTLFRTFNFTFTQTNLATLLASYRNTTNGLDCTLTLDNGATNLGVGARYKGNTSYTASGTKKSLNVELDWRDTNANLMRYQTFNLNNAFGDETIMREPVYFTVMSRYTPCPRGAMARVNINGALWGVYSLSQQENGQLISEWFPSNAGDRWRTPNAPVGGGGGLFTGSNSALSYLNTTNIATYLPHYQLQSANSPTNVAWQRLIHAIQVLGTTPTNTLRDTLEDVLAVDDWLWFLAIENIFSDDDSYWNKGADYSLYYEPESGRIHPLEHDGNEAISIVTDQTLSPVVGATGNNRPLLYRLLPISELRQRYLAHMHTVLQESFHPAVMTPLIEKFRALSYNDIVADPNKGFTMTAWTNDLIALKTYVTNRYFFLTNHAELTPLAPNITAVSTPAPAPTTVPFITAQVAANGANGIDSVWLYFRDKNYGRFTVRPMFDDGAHGDGAAGNGVFGAATTNFPAGNKIHYYVEARSANAAKAASFAPARAEHETYKYLVALVTATNTPVVINEFMASNLSTLADPQGEFEDWIELRNLTGSPVDLTGRYLSDEPGTPRKWAFPSGTTIPANGYLIVWADEDTLAVPGLHASFKLSGSGEQIYLNDTDANFNAVLDTITFGAQTTDVSYGRSATNASVWTPMTPTPTAANQ